MKQVVVYGNNNLTISCRSHDEFARYLSIDKFVLKIDTIAKEKNSLRNSNKKPSSSPYKRILEVVDISDDQ
jgi:hypothetical protein